MSSGYKTLTPIQLANLHHTHRTKRVPWNGVRAFFALAEWQAIREAAERVRKGRTKKKEARFDTSELMTLTGLTGRAVKAALSALVRSELLQLTPTPQLRVTPLPDANVEAFRCARSERRPLPIPRVVLRSWAKSERPSEVWTMMGYALRGLTLTRTGELKSKGRIKTKWISEVFQISERSVRYAQAKLQHTGWIEKDNISHQCQLNRHGAFFAINTTWNPRKRLVQSDKKNTVAAPLPRKICTPIAPPIKDKKTSPNHDNQKTDGSGFWVKEEKTADIGRVQSTDLFRLDRLEILYRQAVVRGIVPEGEAWALNFIGAAVRAREASGDSSRIFSGIVRRGLWSHITQRQEDHARRALNRVREKNPDRFRICSSASNRNGVSAVPVVSGRCPVSVFKAFNAA